MRICADPIIRTVTEAFKSAGRRSNNNPDESTALLAKPQNWAARTIFVHTEKLRSMIRTSSKESLVRLCPVWRQVRRIVGPIKKISHPTEDNVY
jgi:hypothetical protein